MEPTQYFACSVKPVAPVFLSGQYREHASVLKGCTPVEPLLKAAVRSGCWLSANDVKAVCKHNKIDQPQGTGKPNKKGVRGVLKKDWARALVEHLFPGESDESKEKMITGIVGSARQVVSEENMDEVCENLLGLDEENRRAFDGLQAMTEKIQNQRLEREIIRRKDEDAKGRGTLVAFQISKPSLVTTIHYCFVYKFICYTRQLFRLDWKALLRTCPKL